jgi:hypothetical protein
MAGRAGPEPVASPRPARQGGDGQFDDAGVDQATHPVDQGHDVVAEAQVDEVDP